MRIPQAFESAVPLLDAHLEAVLATVPAVGPGWQILPCTMTQQEKTEWCWASATQAVESTRGIHDSQCTIAHAVLHAVCGSNCTGVGCNTAQALSTVLALRQRLRQPPLARVAFDQIKAEITARRAVIGCHIDRGSVGHFVIICGFSESTGNPRIAILDPAMPHPEPQAHDFGEFLVAYEAGGRWDETYLTK